jgi:hypothetical protein
VKTEDGEPTAEDRGRKTEDGTRPDGYAAGELCDYCGAEALTWRKCKLVCLKCGNIVKSCADL